MSLRLRLLGCTALAFAISLVLGGVLAWWNASRLVEAKMRSALAVGEQTVRHAIGNLSRPVATRREVEDLIATFDGDRSLRASLVLSESGERDVAREAAASSVLNEPRHEAPPWLVPLLGATIETAHVPLLVEDRPGAIVLTAELGNEAREIWDEFRLGALVLGLFAGQIVLLIGWFAARAVSGPVDRLCRALERAAEGDYAARMPATGPPEIARLAASFNRLLDRLGSMEARNRALHEQMLTLQEAERAALARDLHDEIGPYLFAIKVDASSIARLAAENRTREIPAHVDLIREAVAHLQQQVKATLGRLRPAGLAEFGLVQALEHLVGFWRSRHPATAFTMELDIEPEAPSFGPIIDTTIYRLVQEGVSNAVRHGEASRIRIAVTAAGAASDIVVCVADNGRGMAGAEDGSVGFGLTGMRERVAALGGSLVVREVPSLGGREGGVTVLARLPRPAGDAAPTRGSA